MDHPCTWSARLVSTSDCIPCLGTHAWGALLRSPLSLSVQATATPTASPAPKPPRTSGLLQPQSAKGYSLAQLIHECCTSDGSPEVLVLSKAHGQRSALFPCLPETCADLAPHGRHIAVGTRSAWVRVTYLADRTSIKFLNSKPSQRLHAGQGLTPRQLFCAVFTCKSCSKSHECN